MRKIFTVFIAIFVLVLFSYIKSSMARPGLEVKGNILGIPLYPELEINRRLSSTSQPWKIVFLSNDNYEKILNFYEKKLKIKAKKIVYGKSLTIYRLKFNKGKKEKNNKKVSDFFNFGLEIIPFNSMYRDVYKKKTKLILFIPKEKVPQDLHDLLIPKN